MQLRSTQSMHGPRGRPGRRPFHSPRVHLQDAGREVAALEGRYQVVRYNIRGHGYSPVPDGP